MEIRLSVFVVTAMVVVQIYATDSSDPAVEPSGLGVCTTLKIDSKRSTVTEYKVQTENISYFCLQNFHFICHYQTEKIIPVKVERITEVYKTVSKCCDGYSLSENGLHCNPVCERPCKFGTCILPNMCLCEQFYDGPTCEEHTICPAGKFGHECKQTCKCQNNGSCNPFDGSCRCLPGYRGDYCELRCWPGYYGDDCQHKCDCPFNDTCDPINGRCSAFGLSGRTICPLGFFGPECKNKCACKNDGACVSENGNCICQPGYIGSQCESACPPGYYGINCLGKCNCTNDSSCNIETGFCKCEPGKPRKDCDFVCPPGLYGADCNSTCNCNNGAKCRPSDGVCLCRPGYYGQSCSEVCPPNKYGVLCSKVCECDTAQCNPVTGCPFDRFSPNNISNTYTWSEEEIKSRSRTSNESGISNVLFALCLLCMAALLTTMFIFKFFYNNMFCQNSYDANENNSKLQNPLDVHVSSTITTISSDKYLKNRMIDSKNMNTSYSIDGFHKNFSFSHDNYGYDTTENFYLEIDEVKNTADDVYDHLDFLRPAKSWKPHYQKPPVMQEQKNSSNSNDSSICTNCNKYSGRVQQRQW